MADATPEGSLDSQSEFDRSRALLAAALRAIASSVRALMQDEIKGLGVEPEFVAGWHATLDVGGDRRALCVLIDARFPYSHLRIAYPEVGAKYLAWPHIEPGGLLCLPPRRASTMGIELSLQHALADSIELIHRLRDPDFINAELQQEFLTYWHRTLTKPVRPVRSLLKADRSHSRRVAVWFGKHYTLVGESEGEVSAWLENAGGKAPAIHSGLFVALNEPPMPPFPDSPQALFAWISQFAPDAMPLLERQSLLEDAIVVLSARTSSGTGLVAARITKPKDYHGFRKGMSYPLNIRLTLWGRSALTRSEVKRIDAAWVHGRGQNTALPILTAAHVVVLGCGSLGSQVAMRLAQLGVGALTLVDPESLTAANVGRHALGMSSVDMKKATALAATLRAHFPHMSRIEARPVRWQAAVESDSVLIQNANLIVACMGEWAEDGQRNEWQARGFIASPIVHGWLEEFGVASHAIACFGAGPKLSCLLDGNGDMRNPETEWDEDQQLQSEPACGTLFQAFGPLDAAQAEGLVSRLCVDILTQIVTGPCHRVQAGSNAQLLTLGGRWSAHHLAQRPAGFEGSLQFDRLLQACGQCVSCLEQ